MITPEQLPDMVSAIAYRARNTLRRAGLEVGQAHPDSSVGAFVTKMVFQHFGVRCVLDVGGHRGGYGTMLRHNGYRGHIISFEPVPEHFMVLQRVAAKYGNWSVYPYALGSSDTNIAINVSPSSTSSFLDVSAYGHATLDMPVTGQHMVEMHRLDSIVSDVAGAVGNVYLKIDAQGWDLEVLKGATGCINRIPALQAEVSMQPIYEGMPTWLQFIDYAKSLGFAISAFFPIMWDAQIRVVECDCVMVRAVG